MKSRIIHIGNQPCHLIGLLTDGNGISNLNSCIICMHPVNSNLLFRFRETSFHQAGQIDILCFFIHPYCAIRLSVIIVIFHLTPIEILIYSYRDCLFTCFDCMNQLLIRLLIQFKVPILQTILFFTIHCSLHHAPIGNIHP